MHRRHSRSAKFEPFLEFSRKIFKAPACFGHNRFHSHFSIFEHLRLAPDIDLTIGAFSDEAFTAIIQKIVCAVSSQFIYTDSNAQWVIFIRFV